LRPIEEVQPESLAAYFKALANAKRVHLLHFLVEPHHLEEIASELGVARQTAQEHVQQLVEAGLVQRVEGRGESKPVVDYVMVPQRVFHVYEMVGRLGDLEPTFEAKREVRAVTVEDGGPAAARSREEDLPRLVIVHGMRIGETTTLDGAGPWLIGRDPHAAVCLDYDSFASARHAEVRRTTGGFEVADAYSSNGTFLDWKPLPRGAAIPLENGHLLRVGRTLLLFRKAR
jgi:DNA-binding transcriptional ArsR family regulator